MANAASRLLCSDHPIRTREPRLRLAHPNMISSTAPGTRFSHKMRSVPKHFETLRSASNCFRLFRPHLCTCGCQYKRIAKFRTTNLKADGRQRLLARRDLAPQCHHTVSPPLRCRPMSCARRPAFAEAWTQGEPRQARVDRQDRVPRRGNPRCGSSTETGCSWPSHRLRSIRSNWRFRHAATVQPGPRGFFQTAFGSRVHCRNWGLVQRACGR